MASERPSIPIPGEHGAWAILYGSVLLAWLMLPRPEPVFLLFILSLTGLFLAQGPLARLLRTRRTGVSEKLRRWWLTWLGFFLTVGLLSGLLLLLVHRLWYLLPFGLFVGGLGSVHLGLAAERQERTFRGEILGCLILTSCAAASHYVLSAHLSSLAGLAWVLAALFFLSGLFCVRMRVSRFLKKGQFSSRRAGCLLFHAVLVVILLILVLRGGIPPWLPLAYLPITLRAIWYSWRREEKLNIRRIGYSEVGHSLFFLFLFALLWRAF